MKTRRCPTFAGSLHRDRSTGAWVALALWLLSPAAVAQQTDGPPPAYYYANGERVQIEIAADQIGVLLRADVPPERAQPLLESSFDEVTAIDTRAVREYPGGILVIDLVESRSRGDLYALAAQLRDAQPELIARSGLVVRPVTSEMPMILARDFIVRFREGVSRDSIDAFNEEYRAEIVTEDPFVENQFLLQVPLGAPFDALQAANLYHESELTEFAHPNFTQVVIERQTIPNDPFFPDQWHHDNNGASGGTADADIDSPQAWDLGLGSANVVVAVVDNGFDAAHADLTANLWANPGEVAGNGIDDDGNGRVDDVSGWDFTGCDVVPTPPAASCGDANVTGRSHGTAVAGLVAARGNNNLGVSGACPNCRLMLIRNGSTDFAQGLIFGYLRQEGANISTNSWGFAIGTPCATNLCTAIDTAATAGVLTFFAMNNGDVNDCTGSDISSLASVAAVSASSNQDRKVTESGFGNCMELLGPTHRGYGSGGVAFAGTLNVATTDRVGVNGYNNASPLSAPCPSTEPAPLPDSNRDYTRCFGGTSAATPTTAGVAALALSADPTLDRLQLQRLLQDTADKVEDSAGTYATATGFSSPGGGHATHGWGRVNSFEAVRVVASTAAGGRGGRDVFVRDNRLDWGNTEQPSNVLFEPTRGFIPHWQSVDIKVDAPPYQPAPTTPAAFAAFTDEDPRSLALNKVYVLVRNRGPQTASTVTAKLHWAFAGTALPGLPADFWTAFPADSTDTTKWKPLGVRSVTSLAYSGASAAGCPGRAQPPCGTLVDQAQIAQFDFQGPAIDPAAPNPRHYCLLVILDSPQDPISPASRASFVVDAITPRDNNVTHKNLVLQDATRSEALVRFFVRNPTSVRQTTVLRLLAPEGWRTSLDGVEVGEPFAMEPGEEILVGLRIDPPSGEASGTVAVEQHFPEADPPFSGGLTIAYAPRPQSPGEPERGFSLHVGVAQPHALLGDDFDDGPAVVLDFERAIRGRLSWNVLLGWSRFEANAGGDDIEAWDLSANLKLRFPIPSPWSLFIHAGPGVYSIDGDDPEAGFNLGAGVGRRLNPQLSAEASFDYHQTVTASPDVEYGKLLVGLVWWF